MRKKTNDLPPCFTFYLSIHFFTQGYKKHSGRAGTERELYLRRLYCKITLFILPSARPECFCLQKCIEGWRIWHPRVFCMILGIGVDTIEIERFELWHTYSQKKLLRIFSALEIEYCLAQQNKSAERFAARFAAREALYRALSYAYPDNKLPFLTLCAHTTIQKISQRPYVVLRTIADIDTIFCVFIFPGRIHVPMPPHLLYLRADVSLFSGIYCVFVHKLFTNITVYWYC